MRVRVKIKAGEIIFSSDMARRAFFDRNDGKDGIFDIDDAPTASARRYFEGALVPAVYYQHPNSGWIDFGDAREALKIEFIPLYTRSLKGERLKLAKSTTDLTKAAFLKLIEDITHWLEENQMEVPDPEEYKAWRDSAPAAGEIYPPLARMRETYNASKAIPISDVPVWRKGNGGV